jgi:hypothetical protein
MKDRSKWFCLNTSRNGNCDSHDCTNEPCIMVPYSVHDIIDLKEECASLRAEADELEKLINEYEQKNDEALKSIEP